MEKYTDVLEHCLLFSGVSGGEISAMYKGEAQNDIGSRTDVLFNIPKAIGMKLLIRSMGPQVISADEIGTYEDIKAIDYAICSGVKGIFTAHGYSLEQIFLNPILNLMGAGQTIGYATVLPS